MVLVWKPTCDRHMVESRRVIWAVSIVLPTVLRCMAVSIRVRLRMSVLSSRHMRKEKSGIDTKSYCLSEQWCFVSIMWTWQRELFLNQDEM